MNIPRAALARLYLQWPSQPKPQPRCATVALRLLARRAEEIVDAQDASGRRHDGESPRVEPRGAMSRAWRLGLVR